MTSWWSMHLACVSPWVQSPAPKDNNSLRKAHIGGEAIGRGTIHSHRRKQHTASKEHCLETLTLSLLLEIMLCNFMIQIYVVYAVCNLEVYSNYFLHCVLIRLTCVTEYFREDQTLSISEPQNLILSSKV